jgi:hypothetical protein
MNLPNQLDDFFESLATNTAVSKLVANDMNEFVESTDRKAKDYFHFGLVFGGLIIAVAGVVLTSAITGIVGTFLVALDSAFFLLKNQSHCRGGL